MVNENVPCQEKLIAKAPEPIWPDPKISRIFSNPFSEREFVSYEL